MKRRRHTQRSTNLSRNFIAFALIAVCAVYTVVHVQEITAHISPPVDRPRTLREFAERYKGVDSSASARNTVLVGLSSKHTTDLTLNWACWIRDLGLSFFVWAADEEAYRYLTNRGIPTFYEDRIVETNTKNLSYDLSDRHQLWAQSSFEKHYVVLRLLEMDYDVFLSDIDIVIHRNPWPHFKRDADFEYQGEKLIFEEELNEDVIINTGFFLVKPTPKVKAMFNESLYYSHTKLQTAQTVMNKIYQKYKKMNKTMFLNYTDVYGDDIPTSDKMIFRVLPILEFASGGFVFHNIRRQRFIDRVRQGLTDPVITHFNHMWGNAIKVECMKTKGYWRYDEDNNMCASSFDIDYTNKKGCRLNPNQ